jgi:Aromatic amino acid lyase
MGEQSMTIMLNGSDLTVTQVVAAPRHGETVAIAPDAIGAMRQAREVVQEVLSRGEPVYGLTTVGHRRPGDRAARQRSVRRRRPPPARLRLVRRGEEPASPRRGRGGSKGAGFRGTKIRIDRTNGGSSLAALRATREAVGDDIALMADLNPVVADGGRYLAPVNLPRRAARYAR